MLTFLTTREAQEARALLINFQAGRDVQSGEINKSLNLKKEWNFNKLSDLAGWLCTFDFSLA